MPVLAFPSTKVRRIAPAPASVLPRILNEGDRSKAICHQCDRMVETEFRYRDVFLEKTKVTVANVLVGVCRTCDQTVSIPHQSTPRLAEARAKKAKENQARLSRPLEDRLNLIAMHYGANTPAFRGAILRYGLIRCQHDSTFFKHVLKAVDSPEVKGPLCARIKFFIDEETRASVDARIAKVGEVDFSEIVRAMVLVMYNDLSGPTSEETLQRDLQLLSVGSGS